MDGLESPVTRGGAQTSTGFVGALSSCNYLQDLLAGGLDNPLHPLRLVRVLVLWECCGKSVLFATSPPPPGGPGKKFNFELFGEPLPETKNGQKTCSEGLDFDDNLRGRRYFSRRIFLRGSQPDPAKPEGQKVQG